MKKIVFIVDDNDTNLTMAEDALAEQYRVIALSSAAKMFKALEKFRPDLILLDVEMPEMNGFEAMEALKANDQYADIPVIFLTALSDASSEARGIELGAADFIMKPFSVPVLINRIKYHMNVDELIRERTAQLYERTEELVQRSNQLDRLKNGIVFTLADIVENRDENTGGHITRTAVYMEILLSEMRRQKTYSDEMENWDLESVVTSAQLHDIGKIVIADSILNKPAKLTDEEFEIIKSHPIEGVRIIEKVIERTGDSKFMHDARMFAAYHHEKWNGKGYPFGLAEKDIPLHGRIMAIIDVYDALVSERPYKKAFTHTKACEIIEEGAGSHFDPILIEVFKRVEDKFEKIKNEF